MIDGAGRKRIYRNAHDSMAPTAHEAGPGDRVRPLERRDAPRAASLHATCIDPGFLSSLGEAFLRQLYSVVPSCPAGFGFVCEGPDGQVLGFIACAESTGLFIRQAVLRRGVPMALALGWRLLAPSVAKGLLEAWRYPTETAAALPPPGILSVAVSPEARGKGVGRALISAALAEFRRRGIHEVKVAVGSQGMSNGFYVRCGFRLADTRELHGRPVNMYVIRTDAPPAAHAPAAR